MAIKSPNHLGDILDALKKLDGQEGVSLTAVARLLGFDDALVEQGQQQVDSKEESDFKKRLPAEAAPTGLNLEPEIPLPPGKNEAWVEVKSSGAQSGAPEWFAQVKALPPTDSAEGIPELPLVPLIVPRWTRAILTAALAREAYTSAVDVSTLVAKIASGNPVQRIPLMRKDKLNKRVQILVDINESMAPFRGDQQQMVVSIDALLPSHLLEILEYPGCPLCDKSPEGEFTYRQPLPGTTVIALTDLGAGVRPIGCSQAGPLSWWEFGARLRRMDCRVLAFVPYELARIPLQLRQLVTVLPWNSTLTSEQVSRTRSLVERSGWAR